jgi:hypothetical protein
MGFGLLHWEVSVLPIGRWVLPGIYEPIGPWHMCFGSMVKPMSVRIWCTRL